MVSVNDTLRLDEEKKAMDEQVKELTAKVFTSTKCIVKSCFASYQYYSRNYHHRHHLLQVLSVQTQMSQLQKSTNDINSRVPQLNEAKKAAVAGMWPLVQLYAVCSIRVNTV